MCSVSHGPSMMESEPEEGLSWVSEGNSRAGQPDQGNLHFKKEGAMLKTPKSGSPVVKSQATRGDISMQGILA